LKFPQLKPYLEDRPAEVQAILLICILAILRTIIALSRDFLKPTPFTEFITDFAIFIIFVSLLIVAQRKLSFTKINPVFGILIVLLLGLNFLQFGGVNGTNCFNYYTGIYVIVMLYSGRNLYALISFQLLLLVLLIYWVFVNHPFYHQLLINIDFSASSEFIFSLGSIAVFTFYLKSLTIREIAQLESKIDEVRLKVRESKTLNHELIAQSKELKKAQRFLKDEVSVRAKAVENQNEAIEQYIYFNTASLKEPLFRLSTAVTGFKGETQLHALLKISSAELNQVISGINQTLESEAKLNRGVIKKKVE
jgi:hypothetical protein